MKRTRLYVLGMATLALGQWANAARANTQPPPDGLEEIPDAELGDMRGRYTVDDKTVAYFGVQMISTWQTGAGDTLQSTLALNMDFRDNANVPDVTFQPTVTITRPDAPLPPTPPDAPHRSVDSSGLANVAGVQQSVQVAGSGNVASNVTALNVHDDGVVPEATGAAKSQPASHASAANPSNTGANTTSVAAARSSAAATSPSAAASGNGSAGASATPGALSTPAASTASTTTPNPVAGTGSGNEARSHTGDLVPPSVATAYGNGTSATASFDGESARVLLTIEGQGAVEQWIRNGSVGQSVRLTADNQRVSNRMQIDLVRGAIAGNTQLAQNVAQAIGIARTIGIR